MSTTSKGAPLYVILWAICATESKSYAIQWQQRVEGGESSVISPFKAPLGISVKVEIFDLPLGGWSYYLSRGCEKSGFLPRWRYRYGDGVVSWMRDFVDGETIR